MSEKEIALDLWEKAIPASFAPIAFLSEDRFPEGTKRKDFYRGKASLATLATDLKAEMASPSELGFDGLRRALVRTASRDEDRTRLLDEGRQLIRIALNHGYVKAFAFEEPRSLSDTPVEVPASLFEPKAHVRWDEGSMKSQGLRFVELRFIHKETARRLVENASGIPSETAPVGRPSMRDDIIDAFQGLLAAGEIDLNASKKSHYPKIRHWLVQHRPEIEASPSNPISRSCCSGRNTRRPTTYQTPHSAPR